MNLRHTPLLSRILSSFALALITAPIAHAATEDAAQRQLREDRERFQREVDRQASEAKIREDQARIAAEQQRTTDELERLRAQQSRQSSEIRSLGESTRTRSTTPLLVPSPRIASSPTSVDSPATAAAITPDFSVTFLADGKCVVYIKGRPPEIHSAVEAEKAFRSLIGANSKSAERAAAAP